MSSVTVEPKIRSTRARGSASSKTSTTMTSSPGAQKGSNYVCPECGKSFSRAQALGAHRSRTHGVAGTSRAARTSDSAKNGAVRAGTGTSRGRSSRRTSVRGRTGDGQFDRDKVLVAVFPNGVPAKASVIAALAPWLDEAERLSQMR